MEIPLWLIITVLTIVPMIKLLPFFGINRNWAFVAIIPLGAVALLWWMAMKLQELERR